MVTHIVMWKLHAEADGRTREENARIAKEKIDALAGRIPGLLSIKAGIDFLRSDASADLVLISTHTSREALDVYQDHPEHVAIKGFMKTITCGRQVVDFDA